MSENNSGINFTDTFTDLGELSNCDKSVLQASYDVAMAGGKTPAQSQIIAEKTLLTLRVLISERAAGAIDADLAAAMQAKELAAKA